MTARLAKLFVDHPRGTHGFLSVDPFRLYPGSPIDEERPRWESETGMKVHRYPWWNDGDQDFLAEWIDPSAELDFRTTERLRIEREIEKLNLRLGGIRELRDLPALLFVIDVSHEVTAIREANSLKIPIVGVVDTNSDPDPIDYVIPSNDDAIRAIKLIVGKMADAALEGIAMRKETMQEEVTDFERYRYTEGFDGMEDAEDEMLLGASTLKKMREGAPVAAEATANVEEDVKEEVDIDVSDIFPGATEEETAVDTVEAVGE